MRSTTLPDVFASEPDPTRRRTDLPAVANVVVPQENEPAPPPACHAVQRNESSHSHECLAVMGLCAWPGIRKVECVLQRVPRTLVRSEHCHVGSPARHVEARRVICYTSKDMNLVDLRSGQHVVTVSRAIVGLLGSVVSDNVKESFSSFGLVCRGQPPGAQCQPPSLASLPQTKQKLAKQKHTIWLQPSRREMCV